MFWFVFALLGFAALRLHPVYPPIAQGLAWLLGSKARYQALVWALSGLSLFGVAFFYNIPRASLLWVAQPWMFMVANLAMLLACIGFVAIWHPCNIRRLVSALPLWVVLLWALSHVLANGDTTSCLMFTSFAVIALTEQVVLPVSKYYSVVAKSNDVAVLFLASILYALLVVMHEYYSGVVVLGML
jgi:uncharacterized membrane protein